MAQNKNTGLNIEELKKSLKTLSSEMNPEQLRRANETLEKLESVTAKGNKENVEIQETNIKIEKSLGKNGDLNKSLLQLQKLYKESQKENLKLSKQQFAKLDKLGQPDIKKVGPIREDKPLTVREGLKEMVASGKSAVSSVFGGVKSIGSGIRDVFTKPGDVLNKVKGKVASAYETSKEFVKDVASTEKGYNVREERFSDRTALSKADQRKEQGSLLDPKLAARLDKNVAKVSYKKMLGAEEGLIEANKKISEFERSGLPVPKELMKQKETLEKTHRESDVRNTFAPVATKAAAATKVKAPEGAAEKANEATEKSAVETLTKARAENPEADNVVSANEKMADSLNDLSLTSKDLLSATKESVDILKGIRADLASDDIQALKSEPFERVGEVAANDSSGGLNASDVVGTAGDLLGNRGSKTPGKGFPRGGAKIPGPASKPSLGGRIVGGLKSAGPGLLKGGAIGIGGLALGYGADKLKESGHEKLGGAADVGAEALSGAGMGAMIGSIVPGVGTAIGGAVGGVIGAGYGLYKNKDALFGGDKKKDKGIRDYETEAIKIGEEALKSGTDPLDLEATIFEKLTEKYKDDDIREVLQTEAEMTAMKLNDKKATGQKSDKLKVFGKGGVKEYSSFDNIDEALKNKEITPMQHRNAIKFFQKENPEAYQKEFERREKKDVTAKMDDGQVGAMQPAAAEGKLSSDPQMDQDIKAQRKRAAEVTPSRPSSKSGELSNSSLEYNDLTREAAQPKPTPAPVIMNNSSNNSTTKIMPMKADPRPSDRGSAFERHIERTSAY